MTSHGGVAAERLRSFVERIERLEEERKGLGDDIKEVYSEAKSAGFDTKAIRALIRERKIDSNKRDEFECILDTYRHALGDLDGTPLGDAHLKDLATRIVDSGGHIERIEKKNGGVEYEIRMPLSAKAGA